MILLCQFVCLEICIRRSDQSRFLARSHHSWDKYIDMHIAFHINRTDELSLDTIANILDAQNLPYHAHANDDDGSGSIWTGLSLGGLGVEIAGLFDFSKFTKGAVSFLDFCHKTSSYNHDGYMHFG